MAGRSIANWSINQLPNRVLDNTPRRLRVDPLLSDASITHSSFHGHSVSSNSLEPGPPATDYEKLEHVGLPVITLVVTMVINRLYPWLKPGPSTVLRNQICSNNVLSQISTHLDLPRQLRAHPSQIAQLRGNMSIQAALFQAHIGALVTTDQKGIDINPAVSSYLEKIFLPIARWSFGAMKEYHQGVVGTKRSASQAGRRVPPSHDEVDRVALGAKNTLDAFFDGPGRGTCNFVVEGDQPPFQAICEVGTANGQTYTTSATRGKKKLAMAAAAWEMCGELQFARTEIGE